MRPKKAATALAIVLILVPLVANATNGWLWDVPAEHRQAGDIAYALEHGWFSGYPDGSFRPDEPITDSQLVTVIRRALSDELTRAETATFLRAGHTALAELHITDTTMLLYPECDPLCLEHVGEWVTGGPDEDHDGPWARLEIWYVSGRTCERLGVRVTLLDADGREAGGGRGDTEHAIPGRRVVAEVTSDTGYPISGMEIVSDPYCSNE